jgi:hypothetical protein
MIGWRYEAYSFACIYRLAQRSPPPIILEIPLDRLRKAGRECFFGFPTEFALKFARVNRITTS